MDIPKSVSELQRFLGMINQPNIAKLSHPLWELRIMCQKSLDLGIFPVET